jgi:hypothetical protein
MAEWWPMLHAAWPRTASARTLAAEGLPGAANLAATSPTDLTDFPQVPADQPMLGVDAAVLDGCRCGLGR